MDKDDNEDEVVTRHLSAEMFSNQKGVDVPSHPLSVPENAGPDELNDLLRSLNASKRIESTSKNINDAFDFLINDILLRVSLAEFVRDHNLSVESVLRIECVQRFPPPTAQLTLPHNDWVAAVRCCNDTIISGSYDNSISIWNLATGSKLVEQREQHSEPVKCLAVLQQSGNNEIIEFVSGSHDQTLVQWKYHSKTNKLQPTCVYTGHERSVESVTCNNDGTRMASGGFDSYLKIWDTSGQQGDDSSHATTSSKRAKSVPTKAPMVTHSAHHENISSVCWSPHEQAECITASFDASIILWDLELAGPKCTLSGSRAFTGLSVSPFNNLLLTSSVDKHVRLWDSRNKEGSMVRRVYTSHQGWVSDVEWSPSNEQLFISVGYDGMLKLWDIRSPLACLYDMAGHEDKALACDWSLTNTVASAGCDNTVRTYQVKS